VNGVHDMGGMDGFGPVEPEPNEPVFHEEWEGRVLAINRGCAAWGKWNIDRSRFFIEQLPPARYLGASYYEKWLDRIENLLVDSGMVTREEIERRLAAVKSEEPG
jgi:hypothetical protein